MNQHGVSPCISKSISPVDVVDVLRVRAELRGDDLAAVVDVLVEGRGFKDGGVLVGAAAVAERLEDVDEPRVGLPLHRRQLQVDLEKIYRI